METRRERKKQERFGVGRMGLRIWVDSGLGMVKSSGFQVGKALGW